MRELVVDLTPTCINRTAIYHVAMDTTAALERHFDIALQYCGTRKPRPETDDAAQAIATRVLQDVARWATQSVHADEVDPYSRHDGDAVPRLYFDPLYALYRPLRPCDVVVVLDMSPLTNPAWHPAPVAIAYERAFRKLFASAAKVVCISDHCATQLRATFPIPQGEITTIPLYLRTFRSQGTAPRHTRLVPNRFLLFVGSLETRKNLIGLIRAFALAGLASEGWTLAIAGGAGEGHAAIIESASEFEGVELLGFVTDSELAWLYAHAAAFVYPSFLEGFGLPLLEAMAYGLPCLASVTGASREIGGDLAVLVDPYRLGSIVDGLLTCTRQAATEGSEARQRRIRRANRFTFERYITALMPALEPAYA